MVWQVGVRKVPTLASSHDVVYSPLPNTQLPNDQSVKSPNYPIFKDNDQSTTTEKPEQTDETCTVSMNINDEVVPSYDEAMLKWMLDEMDLDEMDVG